MNEYDAILAVSRDKAALDAAAAAAARKAESVATDQRMRSLRDHFTLHAKPELEQALAAITRAGGTGRIEIGEVYLNDARFGVMRIALSIGSGPCVMEISGTSLEDSLSCRFKTPKSDTSAGELMPGDDLREFTRLRLREFLSNLHA